MREFAPVNVDGLFWQLLIAAQQSVMAALIEGHVEFHPWKHFHTSALMASSMAATSGGKLPGVRETYIAQIANMRLQIIVGHSDRSTSESVKTIM